MKKGNGLDTSLRVVQKDFWEALTAPESPNREENFEIYRYAYRARIADSLKEDFSHLLEIAGDERFELWLDAFFGAGGSSQFSLVDAAWDFYDFLIAAPSADGGALALNGRELFYLRLDFNLVVLFYAEESEVLASVVPAVEADSSELMSQKWILSKRCLLMDSPYDQKFFVLFKNLEGFVEERSISEIEFGFLKYFSEQALTLEECAERILSHDAWKSSVNGWLGEVAGWFARWSQDQLLTVAPDA